MTDNLSLANRYALIGLNAQTSNHRTVCKTAVNRSIAAAAILDSYLEQSPEASSKVLTPELINSLTAVKKYNGRKLEKIGNALAEGLETNGHLSRIPALIACDLNYYTANVTIFEYKTREEDYLSVTGSVKAELLEPGAAPSTDAFCLFWLCRESGCLYDFFATEELKALEKRLPDITAANPFYAALLQLRIRRGFEHFSNRFMNSKDEVFKNPIMASLNIAFPFLHRRDAIFIDADKAYPSAAERYTYLFKRLEESGHHVEIYQEAHPVLLKIDNLLYETFPYVLTCNRAPIYGVYVKPYYFL